jgi:hypothetical protein
MLRPDSKVVPFLENTIGKMPLASLFQRRQLTNTINKTGDYAEQVKASLFEKGIAAAKKEQGALFQQALEPLPDRIPMPKTIAYIESLMKTSNAQDVVAAIKADPNMAGLSQETLEEVIKQAVKKTQGVALPKNAQQALRAVLESADEAGTISKDMLSTFKSSLGATKIGTTARKELNRLFQEEIAVFNPESAALWKQADEAYAYLSKLKPVENIFRSSFTTKQGYRQFNPAQYTEQYAKAVEDEVVPKAFRPMMDKLDTLAKLSSESQKRKAEFGTVSEIVWNILGAGGISGATMGIGKTPAAAMALSSLALARSSTAKRGIIRKLATSGVMSKEAAETLGELSGIMGTMKLADYNE